MGIKMETELVAIKERNQRVEADKAWETSKTRRTLIAVMTYVVVVIFLFLIQAPSPWLNALIPVAGFIFSTLTLPFVKRWWINAVYQKSK
ncbi:hypothetical protein HYX14_05330 [Candidatus Woesearchaeota archaeon]|nr:hypothetical protein [Candidatus Woesearchaeota archaeon]